ncbi:MAG: SGNH/GDSL hydrolase family protein [Cyanobacteria bacterium P01_D01_bin.71]
MKNRIVAGCFFSLGLVMVFAVSGLSIDSAKHLLGMESSGNLSICHSSTIRIMPLGDSITHGSAIPGGYRIALWNQFIEHGWQVDFVGSQANGPATLDRQHEGHPGRPIQYLQAEIRGWLDAHQPQIILLMAGTNNVLYPEIHDFANSTIYLNSLMQLITEVVPTADLLVASIPPINDAAANERARRFNGAIPGMVDLQRDRGRQVHYVDVSNALTEEDLADGVHPNDAGYVKIAAVWYRALFELIEQRC